MPVYTVYTGDNRYTVEADSSHRAGAKVAHRRHGNGGGVEPDRPLRLAILPAEAGDEPTTRRYGVHQDRESLSVTKILVVEGDDGQASGWGARSIDLGASPYAKPFAELQV